MLIRNVTVGRVFGNRTTLVIVLMAATLILGLPFEGFGRISATVAAFCSLVYAANRSVAAQT